MNYLSMRDELDKLAEPSILPGPQGFDGPGSILPVAPVSPEGRLQTNETNGGDQVRKTITKIKVRRRLKSLSPKTNEDLPTSGYKGSEPEGVDRSFHANHDDRTLRSSYG